MTTAIKSEDKAVYAVTPANQTVESENATIAQAINYLDARMRKSNTLFNNPEVSRRFLRLKLQEKQHEVFCCLYLDNQHRLIEFEEVFRGTIASCSVHPREVVKRCLETNAAAVIFSHNHPSGLPTPSQADIDLTKRLQEALKLFDIRVLDHLIVGDAEVCSMAERGLM